MNTTARIEATGEKNKVHISHETATQLIDHGKEQWVVPRKETIVAKGKGELKTYWLNLRMTAHTSLTSGSDMSSGGGDIEHVPKALVNAPRVAQNHSTVLNDRVIEWNKEILERFLKQIIAHRQETGIKPDSLDEIRDLEAKFMNSEGQPIDEAKDAIEFPRYTSSLSELDTSSVTIDPKAKSQLLKYVSTIARLYLQNPFHNYEHAR